MKPTDVLFVAGDVTRLASIKIRCREIARRLGCDTYYNATSIDQIPKNYRAYICVKPDFHRRELPLLQKRGAVVWDILDDTPPTAGVNVQIASTEFVRSRFQHPEVRSVIIPHYHCNFEGVLNDGTRRNAAYVGSEHWYPEIADFPHERHFVCRWSREELVPLYLRIGIALNLRRLCTAGTPWGALPPDRAPEPIKHVMMNSGVKLINCIGYGLPSVSAVEPAYLEIAPDCTIFADQLTCAARVRELAADDGLYQRLRTRCIAESKRFSIDHIVGLYRKLIAEL